jgi:hypothetical protein
MGFAVVQTGPQSPTLEQLENAFRQAPGLTALDTQILGRDAYGILVKGVELAQANAIQAALSAESITTEVVPDTALPDLPLPRSLRKVVYSDEALLIDDLGRTIPLPWGQIAVIAAGRVPLVEFKCETKTETAYDTEGGSRDVTIRFTTEKKENHLLLEIITHGCAKRCQTLPDKPEALLLFHCLAERRTRDPLQNLSLFLSDLAAFAPAAVLNYGAHRLSQGDSSFIYASKTAFYREITWLLWTLSSGRAL